MLNTHTTGLNIIIIILIGLDTNIATFSELLDAIVFGVISPNIKTNIVINAVATATPLAPGIKLVNNAVDIDVAAIFTILLPISIVDNKLS